MFSSTSVRFRSYTLAVLAVLKRLKFNGGVKHFQLTFLSFFCLSACSSYINMIDDAPKSLPLKQEKPSALSCNSSSALASHSSEDNETLNEIFAKTKLSLEEEMIMAILQQMAVRPATTSPWSRLQVALINTRGEWDFYDYYKAAPDMSLWQGLNDLTKRLKLKPLTYYLRLAERVFPSSMEIGSPFARYLEKYRSQLAEDQSESPFFKAGQILKSGESLPTPNWSGLPKTLKSSNSINPIRTPVFKSSSITEANVKCNFDIDLYSKSVYLVRPDPGVNYNAFARMKGKRAFIVATSVELQDPTPIKGESTILKQKPAIRPIPVCVVEREQGHQLLMLSLKGRDPGQHLFHLLQYSVSNASKISEVETYLSFPRHQFLYEPARMLYESSRGSITNMESFLRMDFPIYHASSLGEVWVWGKFPGEGQGLAVDERSDANLKCTP